MIIFGVDTPKTRIKPYKSTIIITLNVINIKIPNIGVYFVANFPFDIY